jgi:hypothetical protein
MERLWTHVTGSGEGGSASSSCSSGGGGGGGEALPVLFGRQLAVPRAAGGAAWVGANLGRGRGEVHGPRLLCGARQTPPLLPGATATPSDAVAWPARRLLNAVACPNSPPGLTAV